MKSVGESLKDCRKALKPKKLTQEEVGAVVYRDGSYISKVEKGLIVPNFTINNIEALAELFLENNVSENLIADFKESTQNARIKSGIVYSVDSDIAEMIYNTLQELGESERNAYRNELKSRNYVWYGNHQISTKFNAGEYKFTDTKSDLQKLLTIEEDSRNNIKARILLAQGQQLRYIGEIKGSETKFSQVHALAIKDKDKNLLAEVMVEIGDFFRRSNKESLDLSLQHYQDAHNIYEKLGDKDGKAHTDIRIGSVLLTAGLPKKAIPYCEESLKYAQLSRDPYLERKALEYKAWALSMFGDLDEALRLQIIANDILGKSVSHPKESAKSYSYLAGFYLMCGEYEEALNYYEEADNYVKRFLQKRGKSGEEKELFISSWIQIGIGLIKIQNRAHRIDARKCLEESFNISDQLDDALTCGRALKGIGELEMADESYEKARISFEAAEGYFQNARLSSVDTDSSCNPYFQCGLDLDYTQLEFILGDYIKSGEYIRRAKEIALHNGFDEFSIQVKLWEARLWAITEEIQEKKLIAQYISAIRESNLKGFYVLHKTLSIIKLDLELLFKIGRGKVVAITEGIILDVTEFISSVPSDVKRRDEFDTWLSDLIKLHELWDKVNRTIKSKKTI